MTNRRKYSMIRPIDPVKFVELSRTLPIADARSPGEFCQGHVAGALNIPLFDDSERAMVGTLYTRQGSGAAILKGLDIALDKLEGYTIFAEDRFPGKEVLLYCWRGGYRSATLAEVLSRAGHEVFLLAGGYKAYRAYIRKALAQPLPVLLLGGPTGCGKTAILASMKLLGARVIDLEGLAHHKGSAFGGIGQLPQPTNEQFENDLFAIWPELDDRSPVWLEDESRMIGSVTLPGPVYHKICSSVLIRLEVDRRIRISNLVEEYSTAGKEQLGAALRRIAQRIGGTNLRDAQDALNRDDFSLVAEIVLQYYDKAYQYSLEHRKLPAIYNLAVNGSDHTRDAEKILDFTLKLNIHATTSLP